MSDEKFKKWLHSQRPIDKEGWAAKQTINFSEAAWNHQQSRIDALEKELDLADKEVIRRGEHFNKLKKKNEKLEKENKKFKKTHKRIRGACCVFLDLHWNEDENVYDDLCDTIKKLLDDCDF